MWQNENQSFIFTPSEKSRDDETRVFEGQNRDHAISETGEDDRGDY